MGYKKVKYDDIWAVDEKTLTICYDWAEKIEGIEKSINAFRDSNAVSGKGAEALKSYLNEVHGPIIEGLKTACMTYITLMAKYYDGYTKSVDTGDGSKFGIRYTTIVYDEINENGKVANKLNSFIREAEQYKEDAKKIAKSIADLVSLPLASNDGFVQALTEALDTASKLNRDVNEYEAKHSGDFDDFDVMLCEINNIIRHQISENRIPVNSYRSGRIGEMFNYENFLSSGNACKEVSDNFFKSADSKEIISNALGRSAAITEEEKASREWVKWVAVGVAVVGGIILTVVTAGAASPVTVAVFGAAIGAVTTATNELADHWYENGNFDEMDWSQFGKKVVIGGVTGAISGYYAGTSQIGTAIKQPIKYAVQKAGEKAIEKVAGNAVNTVWDVGEAVIRGKSGDEIISVLDTDLYTGVKEIAVESSKAFAGGFVTGKFNVNAGEKKYLEQLKEDTLKNVTEAATEHATSTLIRVGKAAIDENSSESMKSIFEEETSGFVNDFVKEELSSAISGGTKKIGKKLEDKKVIKVMTDTAFGAGTTFVAGGTAGVAKQGVEIAFGDRKKIDLKEVWEKDLDKGRTVVKDTGETFGESLKDAIYDDKELEQKLKKETWKKEKGEKTVEVVTFGKNKEEAVLKEDYDAAVREARKGAYKDKSVQEILGLKKNVRISKKKVTTKSVSIDSISKYESPKDSGGGKTVKINDGTSNSKNVSATGKGSKSGNAAKTNKGSVFKGDSNASRVIISKKSPANSSKKSDKNKE